MVTEAVTRVVAAAVAEASKEKRGEREVWGLRLKVPFSDWPIPTSMPLGWAPEVFKGDSVMVKLLRGRLVNDDKDGSKDFHYFWDVEEWNTTAPVTAPVAGGNDDDRFRTKEELRWTEAMHMAVRVLGSNAAGSKPGILNWAEYFYETLEHPPVAEVPPETQEELPFTPEEEPPSAEGPPPETQAKAPRNGTKAKTCSLHLMQFDKHGRHPTFDQEGNVVGSCEREGG